VIVNPHDPASVATAIRTAIEMPLGERQARHRALFRRDLRAGRILVARALPVRPCEAQHGAREAAGRILR
jgi:hypothetical protein